MKYPLRRNIERNVCSHQHKTYDSTYNKTVFELLYDYHFDEITVQKICEVGN